MIQAGTINTSFVVGNGFNNLVYTFKKQPDGKILVGGDFTDYDGNSIYGICRLNSDGGFDNTFLLPPSTIIDYKVSGIDLLPDGRIVVGGKFNNGYTNYFVILNSDGSVNQQFPGSYGFDDDVQVVKVQSDGKILIGGKFSTFGGVSANGIIRLNSNGTIDTSFVYGTGFDYGSYGRVWTIAIESDGNILVGGEFPGYNGVSCNGLIRLDVNGNILNTFGTGFNSRVQNIALQTDGKILLGGWFTEFDLVTTNYMVRLNSSGIIDKTFNFDDYVNYIYVQNDGRLLVGGRFSNLDGYYSRKVIRLNPSGLPDGSFYNPDDTNDYVNVFTELQSGNILMGGWFSNYDSTNYNYIVALNNDVNSYQYQYVYSGIPCIAASYPTLWINYPTYVIGSDIELTFEQTITISDLTSPSKTQCVQITSTLNEFLEPVTHQYEQTYDDCTSCLSATTKIAFISGCTLPFPEGFPPLFFVDSQYQVGDIFSIPEIYTISGEGNFSYIFNDCYKIIDLINFDEFALGFLADFIVEYSPKQSCEECISCLGQIWGYDDCQDGEPGVIITHQPLFYGDIFALNTGTSQCKEVVYTESIIYAPDFAIIDFLNNTNKIQSTPTFESCLECLNSINGEITWLENINPNGSIVFEPNITITGPNYPDEGGCEGGWSYIYTQMSYTGSLTINWDWFTDDNDGCCDWGFYYVSPDEPNGGSNVNFETNTLGKNTQSDSGSITINFNAGDWITLGVYSDDCIAGPGVLNLYIENNPDKAYTLSNFQTCNGNYGQVYLPSKKFTPIPFTYVSTDGLDLPYDGSYDDDSFEIPFPSGFSINFLGSNYTSVFVSSNTNITFGGGDNSCCFDIPNEIPSQIGYPGVFLSFACPDNNSDYDAQMYKLYTGLTDGGNTLVIKYIGSDHCDEIAEIVYSFKFYKNNDSYFDLIIEKNNSFYLNNPIGGISDGVNTYWKSTFDSSPGNAYRIGGVFKVNFGTTPSFCGFIGEEQTGTNLGLLYSEVNEVYDTCNDCVTLFNVTLKNCKTNEIFYVSMTTSDIALVEQNGPIFSNGGTECYELLDYCPYSSNQRFYPNYFFGNCELCLAPFSAGTEVKVCVETCTFGTFTQITPPHPVWTRENGKAVTLLNAITLGGVNGLNA